MPLTVAIGTGVSTWKMDILISERERLYDADLLCAFGYLCWSVNDEAFEPIRLNISSYSLRGSFMDSWRAIDQIFDLLPNHLASAGRPSNLDAGTLPFGWLGERANGPPRYPQLTFDEQKSMVSSPIVPMRFSHPNR
jgi:hypothetical protein